MKKEKSKADVQKNKSDAVSKMQNYLNDKEDEYMECITLESIYYFTQILCSFAVIIGGIIGIRQYILAKNIEKNQFQNSKIKKAIELSDYYKNSILKYINLIQMIYSESGILDIYDTIKASDMINFDMVELEKNFSTAQIKKIKVITDSDVFIDIIAKETLNILRKDILKDSVTPVSNTEDKRKRVLSFFGNEIICETLNSLEYFALYFNYNVADETTVYQPIHKTYIQIVQMLYYDISINNPAGEDKIFTNVVELYKKWSNKLNENKDLSRNEVIKGVMAKDIT